MNNSQYSWKFSRIETIFVKIHIEQHAIYRPLYFHWKMIALFHRINKATKQQKSTIANRILSRRVYIVIG